ACPAAELVDEHETPLRRVVANDSRLGHLDHKGALARGQIVGGSYPREDAVYDADVGPLGGDETSHLGEENDQGYLPEIRALSRHVGTRQNDEPLLRIEQGVVGHELVLAADFDHRVASRPDLNPIPAIDDRPDVPSFGSYL